MAGRKTALQRFLRAPVYLYRWRFGWLLGKRFLLLNHIGRCSGRRHQTVLEIVEYRKADHEAIVMSGWGRDADWLRNIEARPGEIVIIGCDEFVASHRFLDEEEAIRALEKYERRNWFAAPVIRMVLSRLAGWKYHSSEDDRRQIVKQLPPIAFRPAPSSVRFAANLECKNPFPIL